jgi:hypothetical protein
MRKFCSEQREMPVKVNFIAFANQWKGREQMLFPSKTRLSAKNTFSHIVAQTG